MLPEHALIESQMYYDEFIIVNPLASPGMRVIRTQELP